MQRSRRSWENFEEKTTKLERNRLIHKLKNPNAAGRNINWQFLCKTGIILLSTNTAYSVTWLLKSVGHNQYNWHYLSQAHWKCRPPGCTPDLLKQNLHSTDKIPRQLLGTSHSVKCLGTHLSELHTEIQQRHPRMLIVTLFITAKKRKLPRSSTVERTHCDIITQWSTSQQW
jgi:hypothetical protein